MGDDALEANDDKSEGQAGVLGSAVYRHGSIMG
jgi:hypothetical protein